MERSHWKVLIRKRIFFVVFCYVFNNYICLLVSVIWQWDSSYAGLALRQSGTLPDGLHEKVQSALITLQRRGCLLRDLVRVRDRDVFTAVSRALVGQPGYTYRYLDTRLFTIPWHCEGEEGQKDEKEKQCCDSDLRDACKALWELNQFFCSDVQQTNVRGVKRSRSDTENSEDTPGEGTCEESVKDRLLEKQEEEEEDSGQGCSHSSPPSSAPPPAISSLVQFNVTLINYMDPTAMTQLKEEPYYGMGKMAVGWHHDENLVPLSPVAVYSYSCPAEPKNEGEGSKALGRACKIILSQSRGTMRLYHNLFNSKAPLCPDNIWRPIQADMYLLIHDVLVYYVSLLLYIFVLVFFFVFNITGHVSSTRVLNVCSAFFSKVSYPPLHSFCPITLRNRNKIMYLIDLF